MASNGSKIANWVRRFTREDPPRSKSLIITIFGDSLLPYLSGIWLGELIDLLQPFGMNAQLTRTSCFRLAEEGWLQSQREGRTSRYSLTASGQQRIEHAYHRIYSPPPKVWDGNWTILIPGKEGSSAAARTDLRRELEWAGFGRITAKLFIHPQADLPALREVLSRLELSDDVVVFRGGTIDELSSNSVHALTSDCWNLQHVAEHYEAFLARFNPVLGMLQQIPPPESAFVVQTLLIHSFRRVVLHDPRLPAALLPGDWPGYKAYDLCREIYRRTHEGVRDYLSSQLSAAQQRPLRPSARFLARLGGLR